MVTGVRALLTFVSLLSSLYSVSSVFPKSEFLIMPNILLQPGHLSSLLSFAYCPPRGPCASFQIKSPFPSVSVVALNPWKINVTHSRIYSYQQLSRCAKPPPPPETLLVPVSAEISTDAAPVSETEVADSESSTVPP